MFLFNNLITQNLIQNGSFEKTTNPNCLVNPYNYLDYWQPIGSPDYFNALCTNGGYKVPANGFGISYPLNGNAYCGIAIYYRTSEAKEYIQQYLSSPLVSSKIYYVSFYVSLSDRVTYSVKNIGAYFSVTQPTVVGNTYFSATPQVENQTGYLTDTIGWTKIEGYFTAQGGEQYITIGNFHSIINTDTLYTSTIDPFPSDPGTAYYYIDSVSLYDALTMPTGLSELKDETRFRLYPNPTVGNLTLALSNISTSLNAGRERKGQRDYLIKIYDVLGRKVKALEYETEFDISDLEKGIYFLSLYKNATLIGTRKVVKE